MGSGQNPVSILGLDSLPALTWLPTPEISLNLPKLQDKACRGGSSPPPGFLRRGKYTLSSWVSTASWTLDVALTLHREILKR